MNLLYSDAQIVVCIKPVGLDAETALPRLLKEQLGGEIFPLHRLDQAVGGVMVYARTKAAAATMSKAIQDGSMVKEYVALVHGTPPQTGDWTDLLFKDSRKNKVFVVTRMRNGVKQARLEYRRLTDTDPALVHIRLHTGRTHQIRVQFSSRGYPLIGDHKYGSRAAEKFPMLFSCRITFPYGDTLRSFEAYPDWATMQ